MTTTIRVLSDEELVLSALMATNEGELLKVVGGIFKSPSDWYTRKIHHLIPPAWRAVLKPRGNPTTLPSLVGAMRRHINRVEGTQPACDS